MFGVFGVSCFFFVFFSFLIILAWLFLHLVAYNQFYLPCTGMTHWRLRWVRSKLGCVIKFLCAHATWYSHGAALSSCCMHLSLENQGKKIFYYLIEQLTIAMTLVHVYRICYCYSCCLCDFYVLYLTYLHLGKAISYAICNCKRFLSGRRLNALVDTREFSLWKAIPLYIYIFKCFENESNCLGNFK